MFQFGRFPTHTYVFSIRYLWLRIGGFPHSEIYGYNGYLLLTVAYRSLSRPSSAPDAKAFPLCSFLLQLLSCVSSYSLYTLVFWIILSDFSFRFLFDCMSFANRFFYSIVVHPSYSKKPSFSLSFTLFECFLYSVHLCTFLSTLPWEFFSLLSCARFAFLLFDFQCTLPFRLGGLKWIRTTDLALIRRTL